MEFNFASRCSAGSRSPFTEPSVSLHRLGDTLCELRTVVRAGPPSVAASDHHALLGALLFPFATLASWLDQSLPQLT